jgi:hypothetical protein
VGDTFKRGDPIGCRVANASNNALNLNVDKDAQFPMF